MCLPDCSMAQGRGRSRMSGSQMDRDPGIPSNSVVVVNPATWTARRAELGLLLEAMAAHRHGGRVIPDRSGRQPTALGEVSDPLYWSGHIAELGDALRERSVESPLYPGSPLTGGVGAATESPERLTWTVEEAAVALGVSRAFAYDAVRRGEIPAIKIGRRILIPRSALRELLGCREGETRL